MFLYKEDFDKFSEGLSEAVDYIRANSPMAEVSEVGAAEGHTSDVSFEDLGR